MIKIAQFGEGNFLRAFADYYFDVLNEEGGCYSVSIIKPREHGSLDAFSRQNNAFHIVTRGMESGKPVEKICKISVVKEAFKYSDNESLERLALSKELKIVISNTTEAGIYFSDKDDFRDLTYCSFPAKLTAFLYKRFLGGMDGVYILPTELIDDNAGKLKECVKKYIGLWNLPKEFEDWNESKNYYCNTLVDRIVSGFPNNEEERFGAILGERDELLTVAEPFGLWVIENKGDISELIREGKHGTEVILTDDIDFYKKRKVRVLNGSHTNMVFAALRSGAKTVFDAMNDGKLRAFVEETLRDEIVPFVASDAQKTKGFAAEVLERFSNPYLNHLLLSITLYSISKWKARILPSFLDYFEKNNKIPPNLTIGLSYLIYTYRTVYKKGDGYFFDINGQTFEIKDEKSYLDFFIAGGDFLSEKLWGMDLNAFSGLREAINENLSQIERGKLPL